MDMDEEEAATALHAHAHVHAHGMATLRRRRGTGTEHTSVEHSAIGETSSNHRRQSHETDHLTLLHDIDGHALSDSDPVASSSSTSTSSNDNLVATYLSLCGAGTLAGASTVEATRMQQVLGMEITVEMRHLYRLVKSSQAIAASQQAKLVKEDNTGVSTTDIQSPSQQDSERSRTISIPARAIANSLSTARLPQAASPSLEGATQGSSIPIRSGSPSLPSRASANSDSNTTEELGDFAICIAVYGASHSHSHSHAHLDDRASGATKKTFKAPTPEDTLYGTYIAHTERISTHTDSTREGRMDTVAILQDILGLPPAAARAAAARFEASHPSWASSGCNPKFRTRLMLKHLDQHEHYTFVLYDVSMHVLKALEEEDAKEREKLEEEERMAADKKALGLASPSSIHSKIRRLSSLLPEAVSVSIKKSGHIPAATLARCRVLGTIQLQFDDLFFAMGREGSNPGPLAARIRMGAWSGYRRMVKASTIAMASSAAAAAAEIVPSDAQSGSFVIGGAGGGSGSTKTKSADSGSSLSSHFMSLALAGIEHDANGRPIITDAMLDAYKSMLLERETAKMEQELNEEQDGTGAPRDGGNVTHSVGRVPKPNTHPSLFPTSRARLLRPLMLLHVHPVAHSIFHDPLTGHIWTRAELEQKTQELIRRKALRMEEERAKQVKRMKMRENDAWKTMKEELEAIFIETSRVRPELSTIKRTVDDTDVELRLAHRNINHGTRLHRRHSCSSIDAELKQQRTLLPRVQYQYHPDAQSSSASARSSSASARGLPSSTSFSSASMPSHPIETAIRTALNDVELDLDQLLDHASSTDMDDECDEDDVERNEISDEAHQQFSDEGAKQKPKWITISSPSTIACASPSAPPASSPSAHVATPISRSAPPLYLATLSPFRPSQPCSPSPSLSPSTSALSTASSSPTLLALQQRMRRLEAVALRRGSERALEEE